MGVNPGVISQVPPEELDHLPGVFLRVKLAGGAVTRIRQAPKLFGWLGNCE